MTTGSPVQLGPQVGGGRRAIDPRTLDWSRIEGCDFTLSQRFTYAYSGPITDLYQRLVVLPPPRHGDQVKQSGEVTVEGALAHQVTAVRDPFGNTVHDINVPLVESEVTFVVSSRIRRWAVAQHLEACDSGGLRRLTVPTRLTTADSSLQAIASEFGGAGVAGRTTAVALCDLVFRHFVYEHDVTTVETTAAQAWQLGRGVCQDYAHVLLSLCRACGLPARYVSGQLAGEGGSHAWVEVLLVAEGSSSAEVIALDPTHARIADLRYLTVAVGRDYRDVMPTSGFYTGEPSNELSHSRVLDIDAVRVRMLQAGA